MTGPLLANTSSPMISLMCRPFIFSGEIPNHSAYASLAITLRSSVSQ